VGSKIIDFQGLALKIYSRGIRSGVVGRRLWTWWRRVGGEECRQIGVTFPARVGAAISTGDVRKTLLEAANELAHRMHLFAVLHSMQHQESSCDVAATTARAVLAGAERAHDRKGDGEHEHNGVAALLPSAGLVGTGGCGTAKRTEASAPDGGHRDPDG